jgi:hypothetical protein
MSESDVTVVSGIDIDDDKMRRAPCRYTDIGLGPPVQPGSKHTSIRRGPLATILIARVFARTLALPLTPAAAVSKLSRVDGEDGPIKAKVVIDPLENGVWFDVSCH